MKNNDFMQSILMSDCGNIKTYNANYSVDEVIADEVENLSNHEKLCYKSEFAKDYNVNDEQNGVIKYHNTCDYTMINFEVANEENQRVIDYSGS